jgi:hypothetical protein
MADILKEGGADGPLASVSNSPPDDGRDSRRAPRRRSLLSGKVVFGPAQMTVDCAISDFSSSGARVRLAGGDPLIEPIFLIDMRHGIAFRSRQVWRRGALAGLEFSDYHDLKDPPKDLPRRLRQLWVERQNRGGEAD